MSKNNAKGLTTLRQKYRKYAKEYESDIATFRENPDAPDSDAEVERDDQDDESDDESNVNMDPSMFKKESSVPKYVLLVTCGHGMIITVKLSLALSNLN